MATYKIPNSDGEVRQLNLNDISGELSATRNIDLHTNPGKIKLARPFKQVATASDIGSDIIQGFASTGTAAQINELFAITENNLYTSTGNFESWTSESTTPVGAEDCTVFQGQMIIATRTNLDAFDFASTYTEDWWTARGNPALTTNTPVSTVPRVIETARLGTERLIVLNGSSVYAYKGAIGSSAGTDVNLTMDLDTSLTASCFKAGIRTGWIGTYTRRADQAYVIQWDTVSTNYTQAFPVGSKAVLAIELIDDVPLIITERGEIKMFNNAGFTTIARFPFFSKPKFVAQATNPNNINRPIHPKGMKRFGNVVYIYTNFMNADGTTFFDDKTPNGVWALNLTTYSLTHLGSQNNDVIFGGQGASPLMILDDHNGRIFMGGQRVTDLTSTEEGIWMEDLSTSSTNYGYIVTSEINSSGLKDIYNELSVKGLLGDDDEIKVKFRTSNDVDLPISVDDCVWINATSFNTTEDISAIKTRYDAGEYDEVEILAGSGAGRLAQITKIEKSLNTYTVTIDESIGTANQECYVRFDNWKLVPKEMTEGDMVKFGIGESGSFGQFKIALSGKAGRPEIRELIIKTNPKEN